MEPVANKHPYSVRNGIIVTVVGGLILSAIPLSRRFLEKTMSWVWAGVSWMWTALLSHYPVPGWVLLIVGLFALLGLVGLCVVLWPRNEPAYRSYTEDMLYGAKWRWSWIGREISNLWCYCPSCDMELVCSEDILTQRTDFICERCSPGQSRRRVVATVEGGDRGYAVNAAKREIRRRIRTTLSC